MTRVRRILFVFLFSLTVIGTSYAQQLQPVEMASLRPSPQLHWQRTSPTFEHPDGPVLYQLLFNASGTPGTVPAFDTNPRHLINSPITISAGNVVIGGGSGLSINGSSGIITFANGQTFPASGLPTLAGEVTGAPNATIVSNAVAADAPGGIVRRDGSGNFAAGTAALGNLALSDTSSSSVGVITLGGVPFLHDFGGNTFVGLNAGNFASASHNTAVGAGALMHNTSGGTNAALGDGALFATTTGYGNVAVGSSALNNNSTGNTNSAFGYLALVSNTTASGNSAFGSSALFANTTGISNAAFGSNALSHNTTAGGNAAFGDSALNANTTGASNSAFGSSALSANTTASENSAFGNSALSSNTGYQNSAFGSGALFVNGTGFNNSAFGAHALLLNSNGDDDSAFGFQALQHSTAQYNSAFGSQALSTLTTGSNNTAVGFYALRFLGTGSYNVAVGSASGQILQNGSFNIYIGNGNDGAATESGVVRIGTQAFQTATFIAGIYGVTSASGTNVFVNSSGQLGTAPSSRRYKEQIADLGSESDVLMKLRPVAFYYKPELDSTHTRQFGLVAEEVAQIAPGLVLFDKDGQPQTVRYHFVNAMLLNEVQKQRRLIDAQQSENQAQHEQIVAQQDEMRAMKQQMRALREQNAGIARQMKAVMLRLAAVEQSGQHNNKREETLALAK